MQIEYSVPDAASSALIMPLMAQLYNEFGPGLEKILGQFLADDNYFKLVARDKATGDIAGFMSGSARPEVDFECRAGIIEELVVRKDCRGLGIGRAMLVHFEAWCKNRNCGGILVPCGRAGFYEKTGFEKFVVNRYWKEFPPQTLLHIATAKDWDAALGAGEYRADTLASQGFMHCSTTAQVLRVADFLFKGRAGLKLLAINPAKVRAEIKYEDAGNNEFFPHIYGPLNADAVAVVFDFVVGEKGFILPGNIPVFQP